MTTENSPSLDGASLDVAADNRSRLRALFPSCFAETRDEKGNLVESVDFERLKAELGTFTDLFEARRERYGMDWPGKKECLKAIQSQTYATFKPEKDQSVDWESTENVFIEGDNLEALKLLQKSYYGKVKMIYIDPPYNTGNDFIYPDNYSESLDTYLAYAGLLSDDGKQFVTNSAREGRFHTKWLNMMWPRLYLARNLLSDDGVIMISIDDFEVDNLRHLCNEVFGEENFIAKLVWEKGRKNDAKLFSVGHEYVLVYAKRLARLKEDKTVWREEKPGAKEIWETYLELKAKHGNDLTAIEEDLQVWFRELPDSHPSKKLSRYRRVDQHGPWRDDNISWPGGGGPRYDVIHPVTKQPCAVPGRGWIYASPERMAQMIKLGVVAFREDHTEPPFRKSHIKPISEELDTDCEADGEEDDASDQADEEGMATQVRGSYFYKQSQVTVKYLRNLMGAKLFDYQKDHVEIKRLIRYVTASDDNAVIVDFFAGSGSTAEAVMELNREDGTSKRFVLIQLPEPCDPKDKSGKAALNKGLNTIADIAKERIRRAAAKLTEADSNENGQDRGFRVFKLDKSNFRQWQKLGADATADQIAEQLELHVEHVDPSASQEDLLFEILLKAGFRPTEKAELVEIAGLPVYSIAGGALLICLADRVTKELVDAVAEAEPMHFFCLDSAFGGNDQLKANAVQTFAARNQGREKASQIVFRTV